MIDLQVGRELMWTSVCESATRVQWVGVSPSSRMYCVQWVAVPALDGLLAISSKWVVERPPLQQALRPCYGDHISNICVERTTKLFAGTHVEIVAHSHGRSHPVVTVRI